jgi:hypothetical protein
MSAFFVSRQTVHDTVTAWCNAYPQPRSPDILNGIGRSLWRMNAEALRQRYNLDKRGEAEARELAEYRAAAEAYAYFRPRNATQAQLAKSCACLRYQSCEGDVPETSDTYELLDTICNALGEPPGFSRATWDRESDAA